jgi:sterol desaturase/sphingolipid hydroxylase (fatty acid hydroxylase superfamily)
MRVSLIKLQQRPEWWLRFVEAYPAVPNVVAVSGMILLMFMLAPDIAHRPKNGALIDSISVLDKSHSIVSKAIGIRAVYHNWVSDGVRDYVGTVLFNPALCLVVPFILLLEYLFPYNPSQPLFGKGFLQDSLWFIARGPTNVLILGAADGLLKSFYDKHLTFLTIQTASSWPVFVQVIAALCVTEFANYLSHILRHKIPSFWFFHAVHHSQTELNALTEDRIHAVDALVETLCRFIPFYMFRAPSLYAVAVFGIYLAIHTRLLHSNVKLNLGWLGWVVVSPQFHRVHHSADPVHFDKNYSGFFSFFDYLFGTAYPSRDVYPETGVDDDLFPVERKSRLLYLPANWIRQLSFPFVRFFKHIAGCVPKVQTSRTDEPSSATARG